MGDVHSRISRLVAIARRLGIGWGRGADCPVDRGLLQQPPCLFLKRVDRVDPVPGDVVSSDAGDGLDDRLVGAEDGQKVAMADDLDRPSRSPPEGGVIDSRYRGVAAGLAHDSCMHHPFQSHVVDKDGFAEHLCGEVDPRCAPPDDTIIADALGQRVTGGISPEIDGTGERPIIVAGRIATLDYRPVAHRQIRAGIAEICRRVIEKQRAHLGASHAQRDAAELDRLAARGIAFIGGQIGVPGLQQDAIRGDVEFLRGDLQHRGQHPLADFDPAGRDCDAAACRESDPPVEAWIGGEQRRQGRCHAHRTAPSRIKRAARSTARRMRMWLPQRQMLSSSASAISFRDGDGLRPSNALAEIRMPGRQ